MTRRIDNKVTYFFIQVIEKLFAQTLFCMAIHGLLYVIGIINQPPQIAGLAIARSGFGEYSMEKKSLKV